MKREGRMEGVTATVDRRGGRSVSLRVGIIGLGKVGRRRAAIVERHPDLHLAAVCDTNRECRGLFPGRTFHEHYPALIGEDLDIVFVCAYNNIAPGAVTSALDAGKHVFCEKPPGCCVEDVEAMIAAERRNPSLKLMFGFNHRRHYSVMEAKSLIEGGRFGKILWMRGIYGKCGGIQFENEWRNSAELSGGGILLDQGIHMLDLLRYFGGEFHEVQSVVTTAFWKIPVEDNAFAILRGEGNLVAMLHSSATQWKHRFSLEICLEGGYIDLHGILSSTRSYGEERLTFARRQFEDETFAFGKPREETIFFDTDDSWALEIDEFVSAIRDDTPITSGNSMDALKVMTLIEQIYRKGR